MIQLRRGQSGCRAIALALGLTLLLGSCSTGPAIPVRGNAWGMPLETSVDSEAARYYVESYLAGKNTDPALHTQIAALHARYAHAYPTRDDLRELSRTYSVDFASLFLADRLLSDPCNKQINGLFQKALRDDPKVDRSVASTYTILFVPGWDYEENGHETGADFRRPRELASQFGFENHLVSIPATGSVDENARALATEIHKQAASGKPLIVVGASSAGPAIHLALSDMVDAKALSSLHAWLNFGGILQGTPLVDMIETRPWLLSAMTWFMSWDKDAVLSMGTHKSRERFSRLRLPPSLPVINYLGIPMSGQLSRFGKDKYPLLKDDGPNDGLTLLTDAILPNTLTIVALGSDHFFAEDPRIDAKTEALMALMTKLLSMSPDEPMGTCVMPNVLR